MPKIFSFDDAWYRNDSRSADGAPQPLDVGYCVFKPGQVRFLTAKERFAANEPFEAALLNSRLLGPFGSESEATSGKAPDAYTRAGNAAFAQALAQGKDQDDAGEEARKAAAAALEAEKAAAEAAAEAEAAAAEAAAETETADTASGGDMFDDDEPDTSPGSKPTSAPVASSKPASKPVSSSKKGK